jgi:hypothetical protein
LADVEIDDPDVRGGIERFMPYSFKVVGRYSEMILE